MDSINVFINNNFMAFDDDSEIIKKLREDDEFLIDYIIRAIRGGLIDFIDPNSDLKDLDIRRPAVDSPQAVERDEGAAAQLEPLDPVWSSKAKPTEKDLKATELLIQLRGDKKYINKFDDKKTHKFNLWKEIAARMQERGFDVDAEKCRQKFSNLTKSYINFVRHVQTTGSEKRKQPEFYVELHKILGEKDKVNLRHTSDSIRIHSNVQLLPQDVTETSETSLLPVEPDTEASTSNAPDPTPNVQATSQSRSVKPQKVTKENILNLINEQFERQTRQQDEHFNKLYKVLEKQTEQRGQLIDLLKDIMSPTPRQKSRKRRRSESESD